MALRLLDIVLSIDIGNNAENPKAVIKWLTELLTVSIYKDLSGLALTGITSENPWHIDPGARLLRKRARKGSDKKLLADDEVVGSEKIMCKLLIAGHPGSTESKEITSYVENQSKLFMDEYCEKHPKYLSYDCIAQIQEILGFEDQDVTEFIDSLREYVKSNRGSEMTTIEFLGHRLDRGIERQIEILIKRWLIQKGEIDLIDGRCRFP